MTQHYVLENFHAPFKSLPPQSRALIMTSPLKETQKFLTHGKYIGDVTPDIPDHGKTHMNFQGDKSVFRGSGCCTRIGDLIQKPRVVTNLHRNSRRLFIKTQFFLFKLL